MSKEKRSAWFADQYLHPHESKHTIGEALDWFERAGLTFVRGVPSVTNEEQDLEKIGLFTPSQPGSVWNHFCVQTKLVATGSREGGFFIVIGKLPLSRDASAPNETDSPIESALVDVARSTKSR